MNNLNFGPFEFTPGAAANINGQASQWWSASYGVKKLAQKMAPAGATVDQIVAIFSDEISDLKSALQHEHAPEFISLIDARTDEAIAGFRTLGVPEMTAGMINDGSAYWLRSANRLNSRPVTLSEFASLAAAHIAPKNAWISGVLSNEVLALDPQDWRPPSAWEIRHIVGEGSFTGISGAAAAALVGVTPQNFRKYTARDDASTRQSISFAMWHMLLSRLHISRL